MGRDWGQDLRRDVASFEDFAACLKQKIFSAPESLREEFRAGFSRGYGPRAEQAFQKAMGIEPPTPPQSAAEENIF
jgi:hypothetical protein